MKKLTGSEKQIAWAEKIRAEIFKNMSEESVKSVCKYANNPLTYAKIVQIGYDKAVELLENQTEAAFYIENRYECAGTILAELLKPYTLINDGKYRLELYERLIKLEK